MLPNEHQGDQHNPEAIAVDHGIIGIFVDHAGADKAYDLLTNRGYLREDVNILMSNETHNELIDKTSPRDTMLKEGAIGSLIGGTLGAIVGSIATIGSSVLIPGLGFIAGPIAGALAGAGTFAVGGGVVAASLGLDDTEERLDKNILELKKGEILLSVRPKSSEDASFIETEWQNISDVVEVIRHDL